MGCWSEHIYGNDIAQDFLCYIGEFNKECSDVDYIISRCEEHSLYKYIDAKLVLMDFILDFKGILDKEDLLDALDKSYSEDELSSWGNHSRANRLKELDALKFKIENPLKYRKDVASWLEDKRYLDVFNTFGKKA